MSGNKLQFKLINYYPEVLESFTVYFLKEDSKSSIIITGSDISEPLIMEHNPALINLLKSPFKAFGATASEARDAINALGKGESFVDSYDSDVVYIPSNTLDKQLEELSVGRYLISNVQLGQYSLPFNASESGGFIYLEIKKTYRDLELGFKLEAWGYSTGVKKVKVSNSEGVWSNWKTFAFTDGNVASADKLKTVRSLTIGEQTKTFDGSQDVIWDLESIGVFPKTAGEISGSNLNLASASHFKKTISAATTFTLSNIPSSGRFYSFILEITDGGAFPVTWWANIKWPGGFAPTLTVSGTDIFSFFTTDGGATWKTTGLNIK